jgi:glucosamine--fructose-6-phosphate aminotransferase (isomerizing)
MSHPQVAAGLHTLAETLSQPRCWRECLKSLEDNNALARVRDMFPARGEWLFMGCGSSYYIALAAAASWTRLTGLRARALPASELLLFPDLHVGGNAGCQPVLISRSGYTSEVVQAAEYLERQCDIRTLAISCATGQALEALTSASLYMLPAHEESTVMTRSFTSMLLGLQALAACVAGNAEFAAALRRVPVGAERALNAMQPQIEKFVGARCFSDYVFLAQGPFFGLASEGQLKVKEMSCSYAQVYHSLEFRHGPKAIVGPETLLTFLMSETGYEAEREVLEEMKDLGATTLVVTNTADDRVRRAADLLLELNLDVPECARLGVYVFACQLLGLYTGLKKGLDPDRPRNLTRVVILNHAT